MGIARAFRTVLAMTLCAISVRASELRRADRFGRLELEAADLNPRVQPDRLTFHPGVIVPAAVDPGRR